MLRSYKPTALLAGVSHEWLAWQHWGSCSVSCGDGTRRRRRGCRRGLLCVGQWSQKEPCHLSACPPPSLLSGKVAPATVARIRVVNERERPVLLRPPLPALHVAAVPPSVGQHQPGRVTPVTTGEQAPTAPHPRLPYMHLGAVEDSATGATRTSMTRL